MTDKNTTAGPVSGLSASKTLGWILGDAADLPPAYHIYADPQETTLPYIVYRCAGAVQVPVKGRGLDRLAFEVECYADNGAQAIEIAERVRAVLTEADESMLYGGMLTDYREAAAGYDAVCSALKFEFRTQPI